jgi:hypothetical protein
MCCFWLLRLDMLQQSVMSCGLQPCHVCVCASCGTSVSCHRRAKKQPEKCSGRGIVVVNAWRNGISQNLKIPPYQAFTCHDALPGKAACQVNDNIGIRKCILLPPDPVFANNIEQITAIPITQLYNGSMLCINDWLTQPKSPDTRAGARAEKALRHRIVTLESLLLMNDVS